MTQPTQHQPTIAALIDDSWSFPTALPSAADLHRLAAATEDACVSIYLPTHRAGPDTRQDPTVLRNLLDQAGEQLERLEVPSDPLLALARKLVQNRDFWQHQADGLALFLSPTRQEIHQLPVALEASVAVEQHFQLRPLLTALRDRRYLVLALSQKAVRLLDATRTSVARLDLEPLPTSLSDALGHDWEDASLQFHTGAPPAGDGKRRAMFHGQNQGDEVDGSELERFCQVFDSALNDWMVERAGLPSGEGAGDDLRDLPVVLAGEQSMVSTFRSRTSLKHVLDAFVRGSPEAHSDEQLRERAWALVDDELTRTRDQRVARLREALGSTMASDDLGVVVEAACDGRVASLMLSPGDGQRRWGRWDAERRELVEHDTRQAGDHDLIEFALRQTLLHGGQVQAADGDAELPAGCTLAASFRH